VLILPVMRWFPWFLALALSPSLLAEEEVGNNFTPTSVAGPDFALLKSQSPFTRSINLSDSLILTGIATMDNEQVATLLNKETKETFVVSSTLNSQGWKMVELKADEDLEKVSAKVAVEGGEVVTVRYAEWQLKPGEARPGAGPSEGGQGQPQARPDARMKGKGGGDGRRGGPSSEIREKMMKLSEAQRGELFSKIRAMREKNPNMSREEMGEVMRKNMDSMLQNK